MAFWGIEVKPGRSYNCRVSKQGAKLYITRATLGNIGSLAGRSILQCGERDQSPVFLCSLLADHKESCPLNLEFDNDEVTFSVVGTQSIHITGFLKDD